MKNCMFNQRLVVIWTLSDICPAGFITLPEPTQRFLRKNNTPHLVDGSNPTHIHTANSHSHTTTHIHTILHNDAYEIDALGNGKNETYADLVGHNHGVSTHWLSSGGSSTASSTTTTETFNNFESGSNDYRPSHIDVLYCQKA